MKIDENLIENVRIAPEVAYDKLAQFESYKDLADFLSSEGIRGSKGSTVSCPIANFMYKTTGIQTIVGMGIVAIDNSFEFPTTHAISCFIGRFDCGHYPELDYDPGFQLNL